MREGDRKPPAPPEEAVYSLFPPKEYTARDADGNRIRMIPVWLEIQRITAGYSLPELDKKLGLPVGSVRGFAAPPKPSAQGRMGKAFPLAEVVHRLYDALCVDRPPLLTETAIGPSPEDAEAMFCTHIGTRRKRDIGFGNG